MANKLMKYHFNLIEVVLAIVILSLGMTSIFVLFPVGLNNHTDAMAENSIADMAETIISQVRAEAALNVDDKGFGTLSFKKYSELGAEPDFDFTEVDTGDPWTDKKEGDFYFIRQLSGPADDPYVDFAAVARVYIDENFADEIFVPMEIAGNAKHSSEFDLNGNNASKLKKLDLTDVVLPLVVEISYPADRPYEDRKKAYFRFEIFNEAYELKETATD